METIIVALVSALVAGSAGFWLGRNGKKQLKAPEVPPIEVAPVARVVPHQKYVVQVYGQPVFATDDENEAQQVRRQERAIGRQAIIVTRQVNLINGAA